MLEDQQAANILGGVLDTISLGHAHDILGAFGVDDHVRYGSREYRYGRLGGLLVTVPLAAAYPAGYMYLSGVASLEDNIRACRSTGILTATCLYTTTFNTLSLGLTTGMGLGPFSAGMAAFYDLMNSSMVDSVENGC